MMATHGPYSSVSCPVSSSKIRAIQASILIRGDKILIKVAVNNPLTLPLHIYSFKKENVKKRKEML